MSGVHFYIALRTPSIVLQDEAPKFSPRTLFPYFGLSLQIRSSYTTYGLQQLGTLRMCSQ